MFSSSGSDRPIEDFSSPNKPTEPLDSAVETEVHRTRPTRSTAGRFTRANRAASPEEMPRARRSAVLLPPAPKSVDSTTTNLKKLRASNKAKPRPESRFSKPGAYPWAPPTTGTPEKELRGDLEGFGFSAEQVEDMMMGKVKSGRKSGCTERNRDERLPGSRIREVSCAKGGKGEKNWEPRNAKGKIAECEDDSSEDDKERKRKGAKYKHLFLREGSGKCTSTCLSVTHDGYPTGINLHSGLYRLTTLQTPDWALFDPKRNVNKDSSSPFPAHLGSPPLFLARYATFDATKGHTRILEMHIHNENIRLRSAPAYLLPGGWKSVEYTACGPRLVNVVAESVVSDDASAEQVKRTEDTSAPAPTAACPAKTLAIELPPETKDGNNVAPQEHPTRKRGRPRKLPVSLDKDADVQPKDASIDVLGETRHTRGRPRKAVVTPDEILTSSSFEVDEDESGSELTEFESEGEMETNVRPKLRREDSTFVLEED